jgi:DHA2 family multidrug resistance protein
MVQLPLINQAVVGLQPKDYSSGIALNNMIRQLGGAFGIAIANNYVAHHYVVHRTSLVSNLTPGSPEFTQRLNTIAHGLSASANIDSASAAHAALGIINNQVDRQAYYLSYLDTFKLIAIFFIAVIPLVGFLRTKKKTNGNGEAAAAAMMEAH